MHAARLRHASLLGLRFYMFKLSIIYKQVNSRVHRQQVTAFYRIFLKNRNLYKMYCNAPKSIIVIREA